MSTSLFINPALSPPSSSASSPSSSKQPIPLKISSFPPQKPQPIALSLMCKRPSSVGLIQRTCVATNNMTISDFRDEEEENPPPLLESEISSKPRRIALFVEPSPFAYVSGYKNRFQNFIRYLREMGDEVMVVTTHEGVPQEFYGAKLIGSRSFPLPWYQKVPLSLALSPRIISEVANFKPDIIHASSPGIMVFGALIIAKLLCVPLVMSYHTHVPVYIPRYTFSWLVAPMWLVIKFLHRAADLTLVPSAALAKELEAARVTAGNKIRLWNKGVDSESFHPQYRSHEMRIRLSNGEPKKPLIVHVGRLGVEKSLDLLKSVMDKLPEARIAFVGDGPYREDLEKLFSGMPAVFTGMLGGEELSQAYASGDVFVMPSESETLGLVVLEAMSSGLPVVAARAGGLIDIIPEDHEGKTGFCFSPGDIDDCVNKLKPLLHDVELRETIGKAAREEMEKYDWRAATRTIRNEQYNAAIWFWKKKRAQLLRPFQWLFKRIFQSPEVSY
ncbi:sulfoquinovosyl transferase SQD2 [Rhododendron vialii]|uniref:sulfoquinovosyl transferase SQD2 n=1 Tax=Rhododendron vialii TaxID=182163 RepID=UPI00265FCA92|nr:sulfoquinovosyl transferase SQD2 [Rhododendron vialii]